MDELKLAFVIIFCDLIAQALAISSNQKIRQLDYRLSDLERKTTVLTVDTKLNLDDVLQAIKELNETHVENQCRATRLGDGDAQSETGDGVGIDTNDGVKDDHVGRDTYVHGAISNIKSGFKDEKLARKHAIATVQADLLNVNEAIAADRDNTATMAEHLTALLRSLQDTSESISLMNNSFDMSITAIQHYFTDQIQRVKENDDDKIATTRNEFETALSDIRKALGESVHELKKSTEKYEEKLGRMAGILEGLKRRSDITACVARLTNNSYLPYVHEWSGHWYFVGTKADTFKNAVESCKLCNAHLIDITSDEENTFVASIVENKPFYIDLNDIAQEGVWRWSNNNNRSGYFSWRGGEPNNNKNREDCVTTHVTQWNDVPCEFTYGYICKF